VEDLVDLVDLVLGALSRIDRWDVDDRLCGGIQAVLDRFKVAVGVEKVSDVELFQVLIPVELLVVGVGDGFELASSSGVSTGAASPRK
jgi:hypothetical protein